MHFITLYICYISFRGQVVCVSLLSHYEQSEITHTWRGGKVHVVFDAVHNKGGDSVFIQMLRFLSLYLFFCF